MTPLANKQGHKNQAKIKYLFLQHTKAKTIDKKMNKIKTLAKLVFENVSQNDGISAAIFD